MKEESKTSISGLANFTSKRWKVILIFITLLVSSFSIIYSLKFIQKKKTPLSVVPNTDIIKFVSALGRLEPKGDVIQLAAPPNLGGSKLMNLFVEEGQWVNQGETIGILDNYPRQLAEVELAQEKVQVAKANLNIVKAGAKKGEINAQKATIQRLEVELNGKLISNNAEINRLKAELEGEEREKLATRERLKAELNNAQREFERYQKLAEDGVISESELDQRRLSVETSEERLKEAIASYEKTINTLEQEIIEANVNALETKLTLEKEIIEAIANLDRITEIRPVDIRKSQAELNQTIAELKKAQEDLELAYIKAPMTGQVLKINTRPGENVDQTSGIIELGQTNQMIAIAEVYESEITQIKLGQKAIITSESGAFTQELQGEVIEIGQQIGKKDVLNTDPAADVDVRVVEVKILLKPESSELVSSLTYSKVIVKIVL